MINNDNDRTSSPLILKGNIDKNKFRCNDTVNLEVITVWFLILLIDLTIIRFFYLIHFLQKWLKKGTVTYILPGYV